MLNEIAATLGEGGYFAFMDTIAKNITIDKITLSNFPISSTSFPESKDPRWVGG